MNKAEQTMVDEFHGLSSAVWTSNPARSHRLSGELRAGTVSVSNVDQADISAPFGGFKQSGFGGKVKSLWAINEYANNHVDQHRQERTPTQ